MTSTIYQDAAADARNLSTDALLATIDILTLDAHDPDIDDTFTFMAQERLSAFTKEWGRRKQFATLPATKRAAYSKTHQEWLELARSVREAVPVPEVLTLIGYPPKRKGTSNEHHGPCPSCGYGVDRLISWDNPNSRCWCRQCHWRGDAISIVQTFMPEHAHFRDAVRFLARLSSLIEVPT